MKKTSLLIPAAALLAGVSAASANLLAYEGINNPTMGGNPLADGSDLFLLPATGTGFTGNWTATSKNQGTSSRYWANGGFTYPAGTGGTLPGTELSGGVAVIQGDADKASDANFDGFVGGNSFYRLNLDPTAAGAVNDGGTFYMSWLGARLGPAASVTYQASNSNPFPRNAGVRIANVSTANDNSALGFIGTNGGNTPGWGAWGFKDTNEAFGGTVIEGEVNFFVMRFDPATSDISVWVNPTEAGPYDAYYNFQYTDGGTPQAISLYAFGMEAGQADYMFDGTEWVPNPDGRPAGQFAVDEIYIGDTFQDVAGFVPEPSTYALVFGLLTCGFVFLRRRRG